MILSLRRSTLVSIGFLFAVGCGARSMLDLGAADGGVDGTMDPDVGVDAARPRGDATIVPEVSAKDGAPPPPLVDAASEADVTNTTCGTQPGAPWPMVGHDPARTARSPFDGPRTNQVRWAFPVAGRNFSSSPVLAADGTIYFEALVGELFAVNANGTKKWSVTPAGSYGSPAIGCDGTIYVDGPHHWNGSWVDDILMAFTPTGTLAWTHTAVEPFSFVDNGPAPMPGGKVYFAHEGNYVFRTDGTVHAHVGSGTGYAAPRLAVDDAGLGFGGLGDSSVAFDVDGAVAWSRGPIRSAAVASDGTFLATETARIVAYSRSGVEQWSVPATMPSPVAIAADGRIYSLSAHGILSIDGSHIATLVYPWPNFSGNYGSLVVDASGWVYASRDDRIVALRADGTFAFEFDLTNGETVTATSMALSQGTLYVAAYNHLYALGP